MNRLETQQQWLQRLGQQAPQPERQQALQRLESRLPLSRKLEAWRYNRIETLFKQDFNPVLQAPRQMPELPATPEAGLCAVLADGWFMAEGLRGPDLPAGVQLGSLRAALDTEPELAALLHDADHASLFTGLNRALFNDGLLLRLADDVQLEQPLYIHHLISTTKQALVQPVVLVLLGKGASASVVEYFHGGQAGGYFHNLCTRIRLGAEARLEHYRIQNETRDAWHLSHIDLEQAASSRYHGISLDFGAAWSRTEINSRFTGSDADCLLRGLFTAGDEQLADFHLDVHHGQPDCHSREQFKGLLHGTGRGVFDGRILVEQIAQGTDAQLSNDNLLLSRDAEIDTKPALEIYADDVKCSHGTTVGQLDEQQVFYLRSRGLSEATARQLLCLGFGGEIIDAIELADVRQQALHLLQNQLSLFNGGQ